MVIIIFTCLQMLTYMVFKISSPDGHLTYFALWAMITLGIFLFNAFNLLPAGDKPYTKVDSLDYISHYTEDKTIHNSLSINLQYLLLVLINTVICVFIWFTQF